MFIRKLGSIMGTMMLSFSASSAELNPLLGCWDCVTEDSHMKLRFDARHYVIDGEPLAYRLVSGAIEVPEPDGYSRYPYSVVNGRLTIHVDDSPPLICSHADCSIPARH